MYTYVSGLLNAIHNHITITKFIDKLINKQALLMNRYKCLRIHRLLNICKQTWVVRRRITHPVIRHSPGGTRHRRSLVQYSCNRPLYRHVIHTSRQKFPASETDRTVLSEKYWLRYG